VPAPSRSVSVSPHDEDALRAGIMKIADDMPSRDEPASTDADGRAPTTDVAILDAHDWHHHPLNVMELRKVALLALPDGHAVVEGEHDSLNSMISATS